MTRAHAYTYDAPAPACWGTVTPARAESKAVQGFTSTDPLARQFSWVSPYNFAENSPIANIDLWGLQKEQVIAKVYLGQGPEVESAEAIESLGYIAADMTLPILEEVVDRFNNAASWSEKIPNIPKFFGPALSAYSLYNSIESAQSAKEKGDRLAELESIASAAGTSIGALGTFVPHPLAKAMLAGTGTVISQSGEPSSSLNLSNGVLAGGLQFSLLANQDHPLQEAGREAAPGTKYLELSIITVYKVVTTPEGGGDPVTNIVRPGDPGYFQAAYEALDLLYDDGTSSSERPNASGTSVEPLYEVIGTERTR